MADLTEKQKKFCREYLSSLNVADASIKSGYVLKEIGTGYYVYFLVNTKTGQIIYVGKGKDGRMYAHEREFKTGKMYNAEKFKKYEETYINGGIIQPLIFIDDLEDPGAYEIERQLIIMFRECGLCNIQNGIVTNEERERVKAMQLISRVMPFEKWVNKKPRTNEQIEMYHKVVSNLQTLAKR